MNQGPRCELLMKKNGGEISHATFPLRNDINSSRSVYVVKWSKSSYIYVYSNVSIEKHWKARLFNLSYTCSKFRESKTSPATRIMVKTVDCELQYDVYNVWIQTNANPSINWEGLELGGCLFLKIFLQTCRWGGSTFCSAPPSFWRRRRRRRQSVISWPPPRRSWSCPGPGSGLPAPILVFFIRQSLPVPG